MIGGFVVVASGSKKLDSDERKDLYIIGICY